ncbi:DUF2726 domain-containing protein [Rhodobacterales bacterium HKCCSP123]|nr:DUF2726 domain-containing protein [Rhodobacterales bacterium HKCCSP123]
MMVDYLTLFNLGMLFFLGGMLVVAITAFGSITMTHKEKRQLAEADAQRLSNELANFKSPGHDHAQKVGWRRKRLLNKPEYGLLCELEALVKRAPGGHRLFAQVSYGAFLEATSRRDLEETRKAAEHALIRKRADFLIIDRYGNPAVVLEYQGDGHYRGNAHDRDQAKRVACHAAGIPFVEVPAAGLTPGQRIDLEQRLGLRPALAAE